MADNQRGGPLMETQALACRTNGASAKWDGRDRNSRTTPRRETKKKGIEKG